MKHTVPQLLLVLGLLAAESSVAAERAPPDAPRTAFPGPVGARAYTDLGAHYSDPSREPPVSEALDSLKSSTSTRARDAADYVQALYEQSLADERNGRAEWHQTPYWGGGAESEARRFREGLAEQIGADAGGRHAVAIVAWGLEHEPLAELQVSLSRALQRLPSPDVIPLLKRLLARPHPNADVLKATLAAVDRARITELGTALLPLCNDVRSSVRDSARAVARRCGQHPATFDPSNAFGAELDRVLRGVAARAKPGIHADARWCRIEARALGDSSAAADTLHGWLISEDPGSLRFVDGSGDELRLPRSQARVTPERLSDYARELIRMRARGSDQFSRRGGLTAQFEPEQISLIEANVAAWCYLRGERAAAADLLFPRFDALPSLVIFDQLVRDLAGHSAHLAMLAAFSYDRDYPAAIGWGDHLSKPEFDGYFYQARGRELAAQLRARRTDFATFALPDSASWDSLGRRQNREEQIRFLTARLRLLNCFQWGQPGGVSLGSPQYAGASHLRTPWDRVNNRSPRVINPLVELERLRLTLADVPALLPFLADRNFLPTFEFWRDFHPDRDLYRVCGVVQTEINGIARQPLVDADYYARLTAPERARYDERILAWCRRHVGRPDGDLDLETLDSTREQNVFWFTAERLAKNGEARAIPTLLRRMDEFPRVREYMVTALRVLHAEDAVPRARRWVINTQDGITPPRQNDVFEQDQNSHIRFDAGLILLQHSAPGAHEGWPTLLRLLERDPELYWRWLGAQPLLDTGDSLAIEWVCKNIGGGGYRFGDLDRRSVYQSLLRHGCEPLMRTMAEFMSSDSVVYRSPAAAWSPQPRTFLMADRAAAMLAPLSGGAAAYTSDADDSVRAAQRNGVREWFDSRLRAFRAGARADTLFR